MKGPLTRESSFGKAVVTALVTAPPELHTCWPKQFQILCHSPQVAKCFSENRLRRVTVLSNKKLVINQFTAVVIERLLIILFVTHFWLVTPDTRPTLLSPMNK